ncbi:MAG: hypothetical protein A2Z20_00270 [Bdellovibrionales bacterium RBG_16_40_8]|nr:MAG: hypothetical protein A2Z20_00270 [Bdellovibrionales bacterium RBG_16_40_8]
MLRGLEKSLDNQDCFCIPHGWLEGFYCQIDFEKIEANLAPVHLQEKIAENRKKYPQLIMMKRVGAKKPS